MSRAKEFMDTIWELRNSGSDTEEKLVASILFLAAQSVKEYNAQNDLVVLDKNDLIQLSQEINELS